jgi:large subunit ribosomal protein L6
MSRIGKQPVEILPGVKVKIENNTVLVEGPKGKTSLPIPRFIRVELTATQVIIKRDNDGKPAKSVHGTIRAIIKNMVIGAKDGYKKELDIVGVGYKAQIKGKSIILNVGFSHSVEMPIPAELKVAVPTPTHISIEGADKQQVGEFSAKIRAVAKPEPYKGKGIRYTGEEVRKKLGKALAKAA